MLAETISILRSQWEGARSATPKDGVIIEEVLQGDISEAEVAKDLPLSFLLAKVR